MSSVDVIVPCYNYGRYLRQCVDSVLRQAGVDVRVLVINDASPDNTAEVAAALASQDFRVGVIHHSKNRGHINTYNEGIEWASADYMLLLSADDYLLPDALERATAIFEAHPEVGLIFGNAIELSDDGREAPLVSTFSAVSSSTACIFSGSDFIELSGIDNQADNLYGRGTERGCRSSWVGIVMNCRMQAIWKCGCDLLHMPRSGSFPHTKGYIGATAPTCLLPTIPSLTPDWYTPIAVGWLIFDNGSRPLTTFGSTAIGFPNGQSSFGRDFICSSQYRPSGTPVPPSTMAWWPN